MKLALLFSGQGTQYPGMMRDIFEVYPETEEVFRLSKEVLGRDIYDLVMNSSQETLNETVNTQPALLVCELAALSILEKTGISYDAVTGFSLGEWSAAVASGCLNASDAIRMVAKRAEAMQKAVPLGHGAMAFMLGQEDDFVAEFCKKIGGVDPAIYNCYGNVSVAGTTSAIDRFVAQAEKEELMAGKVQISVPVHCSMMQPAAEELEPLIQGLDVRESAAAWWMNASGMVAQTSDEIRENLVRQMVEPVQFRKIAESLLAQGYDTFLEIGPSDTLCKTMKNTAKRMKLPVKAYSMANMVKWEKFLEWQTASRI